MRNAKDSFGAKVVATDGTVGHVEDLLFDEKKWVIRYVAVDTAGWLSDQLVLLSPDQFVEIGGQFTVEKSKDEIRAAPSISTVLPSARIGPGNDPAFWGGGIFSASMITALPEHVLREPGTYVPSELQGRDAESPIHSVRETNGYRVRAQGGDAGRVEDFLIDDQWAVRYMIVDSNDWMPGGHVPVSTTWVADVDWQGMIADVNVEKQAIKDAPEYRPGQEFTRAEEERLHQHYGHERYWEG